MPRFLLTAVFLFSLISLPATATQLPAKVYGAIPSYASVALSPDGKDLAITRVLPNGMKMVIHWDSKAEKMTPLYREPQDQSALISWTRFASADRLLIGLRYGSNWYGTDVTETRMVSVKTDGSGVTPLLSKKKGPIITQFRDRVIDILPDDPDSVLIALDPKQRGETAVYRLNIVTGKYKQIHNPQRNVFAWMVDRNHAVRIGFAEHKTKSWIVGRTAGKKNWRTLWEWDLRDGSAIQPLGFGRDDNELYVRAAPSGNWGVYKADLKQIKPSLQPVWTENGSDVNASLIYSNKTGQPVGVRFGGEFAQYEFWNKVWQQDQQALDRALPGRNNIVFQASQDDKHWLVYSTGVKNPGEWRVFDRENFQLASIGSNYPKLTPATISKPKVVTLEARDGLEIEAVLTLPLKPYKRMPTVVLPHGGPSAASGANYFDWLPQFLASRGYAVIEPNFRGSTGKGTDFTKMAEGEWGLTMQDDVTDTTRWAIKKGLSDPDRICIMGGSYGGYAALLGATKEPDLYQCAVGLAGVYDLISIVRHTEKYSGSYSYYWKNMIGSTWSDSDRLKATSPSRNASEINVPVLLVHGENDRVVPDSQSVKMHKALKRAKKSVRYVPLSEGDHFLSRQTNRVLFLKEVESFLATHLQD